MMTEGVIGPEKLTVIGSSAGGFDERLTMTTLNRRDSVRCSLVD